MAPNNKVRKLWKGNGFAGTKICHQEKAANLKWVHKEELAIIGWFMTKNKHGALANFKSYNTAGKMQAIRTMLNDTEALKNKKNLTPKKLNSKVNSLLHNYKIASNAQRKTGWGVDEDDVPGKPGTTVQGVLFGRAITTLCGDSLSPFGSGTSQA